MLKSITIEIPKDVEINEVVKLLSFASESITGYQIIDRCILISLKEDAARDTVQNKINKTIDKYIKNSGTQQNVVLFENDFKCSQFTEPDIIYSSPLIHNFGNGLIALNREAMAIRKYFDNMFLSIAKRLGAEEKSYPTILPLETLKKTGYLQTSPQYSIFCTSPKEDIDNLSTLNKLVNRDKLLDAVKQPELCLSPAACFHSYLELQNTTLPKPGILTFIQNVFRHEGRLNWNDFGRLKDYTVREIVFFGDSKFITDTREKIVEELKCFIHELGIAGRFCVTFDPFVIPAMQKFKKIQIEEQSKYELQINYAGDKYLAVASFNLHGTSFTSPFNINIQNCTEPVTGCVGFGLERWVLAFFAQYGINKSKWPDVIKNGIKTYTGL